VRPDRRIAHACPKSPPAAGGVQGAVEGVETVELMRFEGSEVVIWFAFMRVSAWICCACHRSPPFETPVSGANKCRRHRVLLG